MCVPWDACPLVGRGPQVLSHCVMCADPEAVVDVDDDADAEADVDTDADADAEITVNSVSDSHFSAISRSVL